MKKIFLLAGMTLSLLAWVSCSKEINGHADGSANDISTDRASNRHTKQFSSEVANAWFTLQTDLARTTPGFGPGVCGRFYAYSGLALYESVLPGMPSYQSMFKYYTGYAFPQDHRREYYWPAAANAALAKISRSFLPAAGANGEALISQLEQANLASFQSAASAEDIQRSIEFGTLVADSVFAWSKRDGGLPPYPVYIPPVPTPPGEWVPTPPSFIPGVSPTWRYIRPFVSNLNQLTFQPAPLAYSDQPGSPFYNMVKEVYDISTSLSTADSIQAKSWADIPGNFNGQTHLTRVLTQLIRAENFDLEKAALAYAQHGMAIFDAAITVFNVKYTYKLVRPITYIRNVMGHSNWNSVIVTPAHPEYPAAHAAISGASVAVLRSFFGEPYSFTDLVHANLYPSVTYRNLTEYEAASGWSRVLAGVHYIPSVDIGLLQGNTTGALVLNLPFKK